MAVKYCADGGGSGFRGGTSRLVRRQSRPSAAFRSNRRGVPHEATNFLDSCNDPFKKPSPKIFFALPLRDIVASCETFFHKNSPTPRDASIARGPRTKPRTTHRDLPAVLIPGAQALSREANPLEVLRAARAYWMLIEIQIPFGGNAPQRGYRPYSKWGNPIVVLESALQLSILGQIQTANPFQKPKFLIDSYETQIR